MLIVTILEEGDYCGPLYRAEDNKISDDDENSSYSSENIVMPSILFSRDCGCGLICLNSTCQASEENDCLCFNT